MNKMRVPLQRVHTCAYCSGKVHIIDPRSYPNDVMAVKDKLGLSNAIVEKNAYIYRKVEGRGLVRGRTIHGMLAAVVYLACRETGTPRTLKDITCITNIKRKDIARNIRILTVELGIKAPYNAAAITTLDRLESESSIMGRNNFGLDTGEFPTVVAVKILVI